MITSLDVQVAVVSSLRSFISSGRITPAILDVSEFNYQSTDFEYPCLRTQVGPVTPMQRNGECQPVTAALEVIAFSEDPSSLEVQTIVKEVVNNFSNFRLTVDGTKSNPVRVLNTVSPIPLGQRGWSQHVSLEIEIPGRP